MAILALTEALETDPQVMSELDGPIERSRIPEIHCRRLNDPWRLKITLDWHGPAIGTIGIWEKEMDGTAIHETGSLVLPAFQGRGVATTALRLLIETGSCRASFRLHARLSGSDQRAIKRALSAI